MQAGSPLNRVRVFTPDTARSPDPDPALEPEGFLVTASGGARISFHDWGGPEPDHGPADATGDAPGILLVPGFLQPARSWAPVARRLARARRTVAADHRGQGLSDAPPDGYDLDGLAADAIAVAEGAGVGVGARVVIAGHGFGAAVAAAVAAALGNRCAGLVLVDGGWERLEETTGVDLDEFLRGLEEPPEVLRSMAAYLADRRAFDPATWDADQERAARDAVVETAAGHVVRSVRPHVVEALARTMFRYEPAAVLASVAAPVTALVALGSGDADPRTGAVRIAELHRCAAARIGVGRSQVRAVVYPADAHNLMRYRPGEVAATILEAHR